MWINLKTVIDEIERASDNCMSFYDVEEKKTVYLWDEPFDREENERLAEQIEEAPDRYLRFPTKYEIHEYRMIRDFVSALPEGDARRELAFAIQGKGAFRRFRQGILYHRIEKQWFEYRDRAFRELAIAWCKENGLEYDQELQRKYSLMK